MAEAILSVLKEGLSLSQAARKYDIPYPTFVLYANRVHNLLGPSADGGAGKNKTLGFILFFSNFKSDWVFSFLLLEILTMRTYAIGRLYPKEKNELSKIFRDVHCKLKYKNTVIGSNCTKI